jgi:hypothetical protein
MQISFWELVYGINDECNVYFYYTSNTQRVTLINNLVLSHGWGKNEFAMSAKLTNS